MIAKRIDPQSATPTDNFKQLARYIAAAAGKETAPQMEATQDSGVAQDNFNELGNYIAGHSGGDEKLHMCWMGNCVFGERHEDLGYVLHEIEAIRQEKKRIEGTKIEGKNLSYHLVVSFRDGDREKLSDQDLKDIATAFVENLGFGEHQYIAATHTNTEHFHMHLAINRVHPETLNLHLPRRDFNTLSKTCRALEKTYGLDVDRGMEAAATQEKGLSRAAQDFEAKTWEESFQRWMLNHKADILKDIEAAKTWKELHSNLDSWGIRCKERGAGLIFSNGKQHMKASDLDRSCSKKSLETRFGPFEKRGQEKVQTQEKEPHQKQRQKTHRSHRRYKRRPLVQLPGMGRYWRRFLNLKPGIARSSTWRQFLTGSYAYDPAQAAFGKMFRQSLQGFEHIRVFRPKRNRPRGLGL